jgi:arsenate reductase
MADLISIAEARERVLAAVTPLPAEDVPLDQSLGLEPWDITRTSDALAKELGVDEMPKERDVWIALLVANPSLIQRPIMVTTDGQAWVARDPDTVETAISRERT